MRLHIIALISLIAALASCNSKPDNRFILNGSINDAEGQTIYLTYSLGDSLITDSTVIENGTFSFSGTIESPTSSTLFIGLPVWNNGVMTRIFLEPSELTVSNLSGKSFADARFTGSKTQNEIVEYERSVKPLSIMARQLRDSIKNIDDGNRSSVLSKIDSISETITEITDEFIISHPDSYYSAELLRMRSGQLTLEQLKKMYNSLTPEVQARAGIVATEIEALESVLPGKPAPDLIGVNPQGQEIKLSDLKGKVVLIDFWATWCGPCRAALPHIHELYKKYNRKGFDVFCVGDNDSNPDEWARFIEESPDGLAEYHHILRGFNTTRDEKGKPNGIDQSGDQSRKYAVHYLPTKYLISADGTIIGKIDTDAELDAKLAEIFPE